MNDSILKQALAKMLPEHLEIRQDYLVPDGDSTERWPVVYWRNGKQPLDTELLHLCWLVEETLKPSRITSETTKDWIDYVLLLGGTTEPTQSSNIHASWQQRTIALAKVKGVEVV